MHELSASPEMLVSTSELITHRHLHWKMDLGRHTVSAGSKVNGDVSLPVLHVLMP